MKLSDILSPILKLLIPSLVAVGMFFLVIEGLSVPDAGFLVALTLMLIWLAVEFYLFQHFSAFFWKLQAPIAIAVGLFFLLLAGAGDHHPGPLIIDVLFVVLLVVELYFWHDVIAMCLRQDFYSLSRKGILEGFRPIVAHNDGVGLARLFPAMFLLWAFAAYCNLWHGYALLALLGLSAAFSLLEALLLPRCFRRSASLYRESCWVAAQHGMALFSFLGFFVLLASAL